ncbi:MAG: tryptophan synthase subunit alpha [Melioribacteraceae bacterium]|nr:tryptophan synthase subunit alpha [Melioribacteraceae bacterium]
MSFISDNIKKINAENKKCLTVFLTAGFPAKDKFVDLALNVFDAGADIIEIGVPFSDPLADGPVIQHSSQTALDNGVTPELVFDYVLQIRNKTDKPIVLMGYSNPILKYGIKKYAQRAVETGVNGLIIPDIPLEEYDDFITDDFKNLDVILLTTPTSSDERIKTIDNKSNGFLYCVSIAGTTGTNNQFGEKTLSNLKRTYNLVSKNKMQIGFGISTPDDVKMFSPFCDGVIVGSAVIKSLWNEKDSKDFPNTISLIKNLSAACK